MTTPTIPAEVLRDAYTYTCRVDSWLGPRWLGRGRARGRRRARVSGDDLLAGAGPGPWLIRGRPGPAVEPGLIRPGSEARAESPQSGRYSSRAGGSTLLA